jgi:hypothetical protein
MLSSILVRVVLDTTSNLDEYINAFHEAIKEVFSQIDPETARLFAEQFKEKLDEQKRTQENSRTS